MSLEKITTFEMEKLEEIKPSFLGILKDTYHESNHFEFLVLYIPTLTKTISQYYMENKNYRFQKKALGMVDFDSLDDSDQDYILALQAVREVDLVTDFLGVYRVIPR